MKSDERAARVGVDVGGTFTDLVTVRDGRLHVEKTPSTPDAPENGVVDGVRRAVADGLEPAAVAFVGHGTTVATNAVLEESWADAALVTTAGFRDALEIGRQDRPDIYDLHDEKPTPVVERGRRLEVDERIGDRGDVLAPLDEDSVRAVAGDLTAGVESVAVALLFAFENASHERRVRDILREEGVDCPISLSSEVLPEIREYERTLVTAMNAALAPVMDRYLGNLGRDLRETGIDAPLRVMQSNGGLMTADVARDRPVTTLLSGPAAGVQGAVHVAERCGVDDIITMDMGGTSCDVTLVEEGDPLVTTDVEVGEYPVAVPMLDVHTVGAGGGSVAWVDEGGALRVGPQSAGADPGPVCYGRGGTRPTTTDAHLLLGRIDPGAFLSDDVGGAREAARDAVRERVADPLGTSVEDAAQGIVDVANANMERALRVVSVERGYDPRSFALVAYGGAGPLHAPTLAASLGIPRVVVPASAGVLSALGLLVSDLLYDRATSRVRPWAEVDADSLADAFERLERDGRERLEDDGVPPGRRRYERTVDLRYAGQSFDLSVPVADGDLTDGDLDALAERFHDRHEDRYGHASPGEPLELVAVRVRARGVVDSVDRDPEVAERSLADAIREARPVTFDGEETETRVYDRTRLPAEESFDGPAVVEGEESTVVVPPDQRVRVHEGGHLLVEVSPE